MCKFQYKHHKDSFTVLKNDLFAKNMSQGELYQVYLKLKAKKEMDKFLNKIIAKNGTTKY